MYRIFLCWLLVLTGQLHAQSVTWHIVPPQTNASFRGLSVVDDSVAWIGGSHGWVAITINGGRSWRYTQVQDCGQCDFRSIYAFSGQRAIIANAGTPARILSTDDGGITWQRVYEDPDTAAFFDGIAFRNPRHGVIYGDPLHGRMVLLRTTDGGKNWQEMKTRPTMQPGEASFAASGTCISYIGKRQLIIATGGKVSRLLLYNGRKWRSVSVPILQGQSTTGIFSFLRLGKKHWVVAGGDYRQDTLRTANCFYTTNAGRTWQSPAKTTGGYRECLLQLTPNALLAIGPGGVDQSLDDGITWEPLSAERQYHVGAKSRKGNLVIIAGGDGKIAVLSVGTAQ